MRSPKESILVNEIMSTPVIAARPGDDISSIASKMKRNKVGSVIIMEGGKHMGIITERDIVRRVIAKGKTTKHMQAKEIMSKPLITISRGETLENAANFMVKKRIKKLGVVDEKGKLVGIVSESDIIKNANYLIDVLKELLATGYSAD
ncbi:MAG: cyclic nucleotide-binding/CBS domain-containing protein [Candidatus Micrarchaeia archaeon]